MMNTRLNMHRTGLALLTCLGPFLTACTAVLPAQRCENAITPEMLFGPWTAVIDGQVQAWTLTLHPHPEHQGSLRGEIRQGTLRYPVVADLDEGEFTMEESHDGQRIAATWQGRLPKDSCEPPQILKGERHPHQGPANPFVMHRTPPP